MVPSDTGLRNEMTPQPAERPDGSRTRARILQALAGHPGIHKSELCRQLGLGWGTVSHHLRRLTERGQVLTVTRGRVTELFPFSKPNGQWMALLGEGLDASLVRALATGPPQTLEQLCAATDASRRSVRRHLDVLVRASLVETQDGAFRLRPLLADRLVALEVVARSIDAVRLGGPRKAFGVLMDPDRIQKIHEAFRLTPEEVSALAAPRAAPPAAPGLETLGRAAPVPSPPPLE